MTTELLEVPGAHLHYEIIGSGPVLLLIPGGTADGGMFAGMAALLAQDYTVVTYDPRGLSRSTLDGPPGDIAIGVQADDSHRLLAAITSEPAYVFGSSGGAVTGLELVTRHAEQVSTLVAHEPPLTELLPEKEAQRAAVDEIYETYRTQGAGPALGKFLATAGLLNDQVRGAAGPPGAKDAGTAAAIARFQGNLNLFFAHMLRPITRYVPDADALRAASTRIVVGRGTGSAGQLAHRAAGALADLLGTPEVDFPGGHGGFMEQPAEFARTLHGVLSEAKGAQHGTQDRQP
jgi:pimeloyl-ACP methyl ester carboxylesterase